MSKLLDIMEEKLVPAASVIASQKHLVAIRDAFVASMPLMVLGSLGTLINTLPIPAYQNFMLNLFGDQWTAWGAGLNNGTFNILSVLTVLALGYNLGKAYGKDGLATGIVAVSSFFIFGGITGMNARGLFVALLCGIVSSELFIRLSNNKKLIVKMPEGVPPAVGKAFDALFPAMITLGIFGIVPLITANAGIEDIVAVFYEAIQTPFMGLSSNIWAAIVIPFMIQILWFFGIHGGNVLAPLMETLNAPAIEANINALAAGQAAPYLINKPFMTAFVHLGGAGATLGLVTAILIIGRKAKAMRTISSLSAAPAVFNINEPMIFGFPIVLNPLLFIPFIGIPIILCVISFLATSWGLVPAATFVVPWNIPPIIGGVLVTQSWRGGVLAAINIVLSVLLYLPFVSIIARKEKIEE